MSHNKKFKSSFLLSLLFLISISVSCQRKNKIQKTSLNQYQNIITGANQTETYLGLLKNKNVAIVANNTSVILKEDSFKYEHLVDSLLTLHINITKVFAPEHGFRGKADAGELVNNFIDSKTKLPVFSLYGANKKPSSEVLKNINLVVFDIQDVGVRFYTYISTLHYVMEACAENEIPMIILDRPNPNGHYVDGPIVENNFKSFVGMHPVPIVYGMTIGEYAKMINGEKWLHNGIHCNLTVIPLKNYTHNSTYSLPLRPSPNLPNDKSINLYPSLCLFEGTTISCGRGTEKQFQVFGSPYLPKNSYKFTFTPEPNFGSKKPKYMGTKCYGLDLSETKYLGRLNFSWLIDAYHATSKKDEFFNKFFDKLAGSEKLKNQIKQGLSMNDIRTSWQKDLTDFKKTREKYLMYPKH